jgi:hypothetical protein
MKKLVHRLHEAGAWGFVRLVLWACENRTSGDLSGLSDEDLELAVDWHGDPGALIATLEAVGFLDGPEKSRVIHDWLKHQPYVAGAEDRSDTSRFNVLIKYHGFAGAVQRMPEFYERNQHRYQKHSTANTQSSTASQLQAKTATPSPVPSPVPSPNQEGAGAPPVPDELALSADVKPDTQDESPPQKKKKRGAVRERNELLDALAVLSGGSVETVTGSMWGAAAKALSEIKAVCPDVTPEMIGKVAQAYRIEWPKATLSPSALAKHWSQFAPGAKKEGGRVLQGVAEPTWGWRAVAAELGLGPVHWVMLERADKIKILRKQMEGVTP